MWTLRAAFEVDVVHNVAALIARVWQSVGAASGSRDVRFAHYW